MNVIALDIKASVICKIKILAAPFLRFTSLIHFCNAFSHLVSL